MGSDHSRLSFASPKEEPDPWMCRVTARLLSLDLRSCLLAAAPLQIQTRDSRSEQGHGCRFGRGVIGGCKFKLDAVVPEVTIGIESKRDAVSVKEVGAEYLKLLSRKVVNEGGRRHREALREQERVADAGGHERIRV